MMAIAARFAPNFFNSFSMHGLFLAISFVAISICTNSAQAGDLVFAHPTIREAIPGAPVAAGYISITNNSDSADRLVAAETSFAGMTQIHEMSVTDGIMRMRQLKKGLEIPAGATVLLKSGGYHIMFMRLKESPKAGEVRKVTLTFEKAGTMEMDFTVKTKAEISMH